MPSSISNSESAGQAIRLDRFTITLLALVVVSLLTVELLTRVAFDRTSKVQVREVAQRKSLMTVKDSGVGDPRVAVLGNSLMLSGVDVPLLTQKLEPNYTPVPYFVLGTEYYDWYYGLKRLFAEGVRPRYVLLGLSPNQLVSTYTRGDYSARYLFLAGDLPTVARQTHMDLTTASGFMLSHFSEAYSTREITRGFLMSRFLPQVGELLHNRLGATHAPDIDDATLRRANEELNTNAYRTTPPCVASPPSACRRSTNSAAPTASVSCLSCRQAIKKAERSFRKSGVNTASRFCSQSPARSSAAPTTTPTDFT